MRQLKEKHEVGKRTMGYRALIAAIGVGLLAAQPSAGEPAKPEIFKFEGICSATAGVMLRGFSIAVADADDNDLQIYALTGGRSGGTIDLHALSEVNEGTLLGFSSFQGAARVGDRIYFIGSHARQKAGHNRPNFRRLVSVESQIVNGREQLSPVDNGYLRLAHDIGEDSELKKVSLERSIKLMYPKLDRLAPQLQGFNIQGLAPSRDGKGLFIGLRNPVRRNRGIVLELRNPSQLMKRESEASFGPPILLGLGGRGIVSIDFSPAVRSYFILAADATKDTNFAVYRWSGQTNDSSPVLVHELSTPINPHALIVGRIGNRALLLSNDALYPREATKAECQYRLDPDGTCPCHWLKDESARWFRGQWIELPGAEAPAPPG
jgi:hypothetical protein